MNKKYAMLHRKYAGKSLQSLMHLKLAWLLAGQMLSIPRRWMFAAWSCVYGLVKMTFIPVLQWLSVCLSVSFVCC